MTGTVRLALALMVGVLAAACGEPRARTSGSTAPDGGAPDGGIPDSGTPDGGAGDVSYLPVLASSDDYAAVAGPGAEVKYLTTVDGKPALAPLGQDECAFQNTRAHPYHLFFLRTFPEHSALSAARYEDLVLRRASRSFWGGGLKLFAATPHPKTGRTGVIAYTVYAGAGAGEQLTVAELVELDQRLERCVPYARELLVLVPDGAEQAAHLAPLAAELDAAGVVVVDPTSLRPGLTAEIYSEGEAYGYLKIVPQGGTTRSVSPRDVLIAESAPNDLTLVAGLVTRLPQSLASHVNLRLREKGIPSAAVPGIYDNAVVAGLVDRLVHLVATSTNVSIEPARLEDARAFWESRRPDVGQPASDLTVAEPRGFAAIGHDDAVAFGTKAANLGELRSVLPPENRMEGFAIPFSAYTDFVTQRGLTAQIDDLLADPLVRTDAAHKRARLSALRAGFRNAPLLPGFVASLETHIRAAYGDAGLTTRLRFRSSTNAEDLPGLTGAGLYDSRSGCLADDLDADLVGPSACLTPEHEAYLRAELIRRQAELVEHPERTFLVDLIADLEGDLANEKSAWLAVRRVWASLWNERAFDDREYYGIDHRRVFMGIAVHPTLVGEQLESVIVTNLEAAAATPLYRVVSQQGEIGVAEPIDPGATPEVLTFRRGPGSVATDVRLVAPSSLVPGGASLWSDAALTELAALLFTVQDHFEASVYPGLSPLSLDIEADVTMDGRTVLKQARPYVELGP
jgi:pyruvate, water dikinase